MIRWEIVYIYILCDPDTDTPMYAGQTNRPKTRLNHHIADVLLRGETSSLKQKWIKSLLEQGKTTIMKIIQTFDCPCDSKDICKAEQHWIKQYGRVNTTRSR
jgi:predicted GIY-YIG superfamily endonuclease